MAGKKRGEKLSEEELEAERAGERPDPEALSALDANIAIPVDPAIAADVLAGDDPPDVDGPESRP